MTFVLSTTDAVIIVLYLIFVIALGFYFSTKHKGAEDYFLAGRNLTWPIIGFSLFASNMSSNSLVGLAGAGYKDGFSVYSYEWMAVVILIVFAVFFLPFYLKNKIFTIPEYLEKRYSYVIRAYASGIAIILNILVDIAATLYAGGLVINLIFPGFELWQIIVGLAIIAGVYTVTGGLSSVMYTDAVQAVILIVGSTLITIFAYNAAGGWEAVEAITQPSHFDVLKPVDDPVLPWPSVSTGVLLIGFYFWGTNQYITQRTLAARNVRQGQWGAMFAGFLKLSILFIMIFPGAFARVLYPEMVNMDMIYPTMLFDLLPTGLLGLVLAGLIAAMMSSLDSGLNSVSTLFTMDFVQKFRPNADSKSLMRTGQIVTFLVMIIAILWAPQIGNFEKLWDYLQNTLAWFCPPIVALFVMGLFSKKSNDTGAIASVGLGFAITLLLILNEVFSFLPDLPNFLYVASIHFLICCGAIFLFSRFGQTKPEAELAKLVWTKQEFDAETVELKQHAWWQNYRYHGIALLILVTIILLMY
ncbi:MAG: sodium:solute symporter [Bacteroidota bacterium]